MKVKDVNINDVYLCEGQPLRFLGGQDQRVCLSKTATGYRVQPLTQAPPSRSAGALVGYPAVVIADGYVTDEALEDLRALDLGEFLGDHGPELVSGARRFLVVTPVMMRAVECDYQGYRDAERRSAERTALWLGVHDRQVSAVQQSKQYAELFERLGVRALPTAQSEPAITVRGEALERLAELLTSRLLPREGLLAGFSLPELEDVTRGAAALLVSDPDDGSALTEEEHAAITKARAAALEEQHAATSGLTDPAEIAQKIVAKWLGHEAHRHLDVRRWWARLLELSGREGAWKKLEEAAGAVVFADVATPEEAAKKIIHGAFWQVVP